MNGSIATETGLMRIRWWNMFIEQFGEGRGILKAHRPGSNDNAKVGGAQQLAGLLQPEVQ